MDNIEKYPAKLCHVNRKIGQTYLNLLKSSQRWNPTTQSISTVNWILPITLHHLQDTSSAQSKNAQCQQYQVFLLSLNYDIQFQIPILNKGNDIVYNVGSTGFLWKMSHLQIVENFSWYTKKYYQNKWFN